MIFAVLLLHLAWGWEAVMFQFSGFYVYDTVAMLGEQVLLYTTIFHNSQGLKAADSDAKERTALLYGGTLKARWAGVIYK